MVERVGEQIEHGLLQFGLEVDEQVAAGDEVDAWERDAAAQVLMAEDHHLPQRLGDAEALVERLEVAPKVVVRQHVQEADGVDAAARELDGAFVEVGREDLDSPLGSSGPAGRPAAAPASKPPRRSRTPPTTAAAPSLLAARSISAGSTVS